jgi:transposase-like protein
VVGNTESEASWSEFFRNLLDRGMRRPTTVTSNGAPGLINAITVVFDASVRIRCWFHHRKMFSFSRRRHVAPVRNGTRHRRYRSFRSATWSRDPSSRRPHGRCRPSRSESS